VGRVGVYVAQRVRVRVRVRVSHKVRVRVYSGSWGTGLTSGVCYQMAHLWHPLTPGGDTVQHLWMSSSTVSHDLAPVDTMLHHLVPSIESSTNQHTGASGMTELDVGSGHELDVSLGSRA
jgi:hypothetical protein